MATPIEVRLAESDADAALVHRALMMMAVETRIAEVNPIKVMRRVVELMGADGGGVLMAMAGDELAGTASLFRTETWFSDAEFFTDQWLYVTPPYRDGGTLRAMLDDIRAIASRTGLPAIVTHTKGRNPGKPRSGFERIAELAAFQPRGLVLGFFP